MNQPASGHSLIVPLVSVADSIWLFHNLSFGSQIRQNKIYLHNILKYLSNLSFCFPTIINVFVTDIIFVLSAKYGGLSASWRAQYVDNPRVLPSVKSSSSSCAGTLHCILCKQVIRPRTEVRICPCLTPGDVTPFCTDVI